MSDVVVHTGVPHLPLVHDPNFPDVDPVTGDEAETEELPGS